MKPEFYKPLRKLWRITQKFGARPEVYGSGGHHGIDLGAKVGTKVYSSRPGIVHQVKLDQKGYGRHIIIDHGLQDDGYWYTTLYAHLAESLVSVGQSVNEYTVIGKSGGNPYDNIDGDGFSTGAHLHWEIRRTKATNPNVIERKHAVDPEMYLAELPKEISESPGIPDWAKESVKFVGEQGWIKNWDDLNRPISRPEMAVILHRLFNTLKHGDA